MQALPIAYYNYLTLPSGKYCELHEIYNDSYLTILKFCQSENYKGFFLFLDSIIKETITDFDELDIIEKAYIYIAMCLYSVKPTLVVSNSGFFPGQNEIPLSVMLSNLEQRYKNVRKIVTLNNHAFELGFPRELRATEEAIEIDYSSSVRKIDGEPIDLKTNKEIISSISPDYVFKIEEEAKKLSKLNCDIVSREERNSIDWGEINIASTDIFHIIFLLYKEPLDGYYSYLFSIVNTLKFSLSDIFKMTPFELTFMQKTWEKVQEEQKKEGKAVINPRMADTLTG